MKKLLFLSTISIMICSVNYAQFNHANLKIRSTDNVSQGPSNSATFDLRYSHENLRLYPIIANTEFINHHSDLGKFTLLRQAIEEKKIVITETGASEVTNGSQLNQGSLNINNQNFNSGEIGGTVNTLYAKNISQDTIFIMAGEVVKGGKQDRVIGEDIVIIPGQEVNLSAFCVEHNRWATKDGNAGHFNGYFNVSSMDIRKIVTEEKNQGNVWSKVDEHTNKNAASSATQTYTNLANSEEYQRKLNGYLKSLDSVFVNDPSVIGVIAVTGDKVIGCDLFATHQLFNDSYSNLLHSYAGYAITNGSDVKISNEKVYSYIDEILSSEEEQIEKVEKNGTVYEYNKRKIHLTKY
jgi:hypothetical protein